MTIDEAITALNSLKTAMGGGEAQIEVRQLNGVERPVRSMEAFQSQLPRRACVIIQLQDEAVHG